MLAAGVCLSVGITAYDRALKLGPVSVVVPILGTFLVTSSLAGVALLDEPLALRKALGVALAALGVLLVTTE